AEPRPELLRATEDAGSARLEQRPELVQVVLDGGAAEAEPMPRVELAYGLVRAAPRILDSLRFVEDESVKRLLFERLDVPDEDRVGRQDDVEAGEPFPGEPSFGTVKDRDFEPRRELAQLPRPPPEQARWHHDEARQVH